MTFRRYAARAEERLGQQTLQLSGKGEREPNRARLHGYETRLRCGQSLLPACSKVAKEVQVDGASHGRFGASAYSRFAPSEAALK